MGRRVRGGRGPESKAPRPVGQGALDPRRHRRLRRPTHEGYLICLRDSDELVGVANISEIVRGASRSGYLGYYVFRPYERRGLMTEGLRLVVRDAFRRLGLHRVEANIQPVNHASIRLIRRLGFRREGYSPRYLKIQGR